MTTSELTALGDQGNCLALELAEQALGHGGAGPSSLGQIDAATIDRIAASLIAPVSLPAGAPAIIPDATVPSGWPAGNVATTSLPGSLLQASPPGGRIRAAVVAGTTIPGAGVPGAPAPGISAPGRALAGGATPSAPPASVDHLTGGLPRLFDAPAGLPAAHAPSYYFLTPPLAPSPSPAGPAIYRRPFDVADIRRDFPILSERIHGRPLVWLDNAATTHKPRAVIDRLVHYYEHEYSNVHRGAHTLAARSTDAFEAAREKVQRFLGASSAKEIVFVRGTTEAVNLVANSWGRKHVGKGDEIILTTLEHHSNIVPWQFLAEEVGATIRVVPVTDRGEVLLGDYERLLNARTRLVAITHVSNALGTILPVREMVAAAHRHGARVLVDGAQAVSHFPVNVQSLDADFYTLSGHKLFAPTGVGVLYGKKAILDEMPPWQGGGNMIDRVTFSKSTFADAPARFEAGTGTLGPAVGLGAAVDYLERIGMDNIAIHERELLAYATDALSRISGVHLIGTAPDKAGVVSFIVDGVTTEEMGGLLDQEGIAVRAGHHCAQPTMDRFGVTSTVRPSLALYNTHAEIDHLEKTVRRILRR